MYWNHVFSFLFSPFCYTHLVFVILLSPLPLESALTHHQTSAGASEQLSYHHAMHCDTQRSHRFSGGDLTPRRVLGRFDCFRVPVNGERCLQQTFVVPSFFLAASGRQEEEDVSVLAAQNTWPELASRRLVSPPHGSLSSLGPAPAQPTQARQPDRAPSRPRPSEQNLTGPPSPWSVSSTWPSRPSAERLRSRWTRRPSATCRSCLSTSPSSSSACSSFTSLSCWAAEGSGATRREFGEAAPRTRVRLRYGLHWYTQVKIPARAIPLLPYVSLTLLGRIMEEKWIHVKTIKAKLSEIAPIRADRGSAPVAFFLKGMIKSDPASAV